MTSIHALVFQNPSEDLPLCSLRTLRCQYQIFPICSHICRVHTFATRSAFGDETKIEKTIIEVSDS
jgi:hypothetical protein